MTPRGLLRSAVVVVLVTAVTVLVTGFYSVTAPAVYAARGTYVIGPGDDLDDPESIVRSFDSLQGHGIIPTLVEMLSSASVAERAGAPLGLDARALEAFDVRANVLSGSTTLELTVLGPEPRLTGELALGIGAEATELFEDIYPVYTVRALDQPGVPTAPHGPRLVRNLAVALPLGALLGIALVLARQRLDDEGRPPDRPQEERRPPERSDGARRTGGGRDKAIPAGAPTDRPPPGGGSRGFLPPAGARRTSRSWRLESADGAAASARGSGPELSA